MPFPDLDALGKLARAEKATLKRLQHARDRHYVAQRAYYDEIRRVANLPKACHARHTARELAVALYLEWRLPRED